ncbi:MAG: hypothetical protein LAP61_05665 [Acidobacteriia bacterium]|nr:hypothetical protein [Terriglobia bacterium]
MIFRNLDAAGDWSFGQGLANYVDKNAAIGLNIRTRIYSWLGDCFFDQQAGIDWWNRLGSKNQKVLLDADLRRIILQSEGVTGLVSFDSVLTVRAYTAHFSVNTIYSQAYVDSVKQELPNA